MNFPRSSRLVYFLGLLYFNLLIAILPFQMSTGGYIGASICLASVCGALLFIGYIVNDINTLRFEVESRVDEFRVRLFYSNFSFISRKFVKFEEDIAL